MKKICLILIFFSASFSQIQILPRYCINSNFVLLSDFSENSSDDELLFDIENSVISSEFIKKILAKKKIKFKDLSAGEVEFIIGCNFYENLHTQFLKEIYLNYGVLRLNSLSFIPQMPLLDENYEISNIKITNIRSPKGTFKATLSDLNGNKKVVFFKYKIDAKIGVFIAKKDMKMRHILNLSDFSYEFIDLARYKLGAIREIPSKKTITKRQIKKGEILTNSHLSTLCDVKKGTKINAIFKDSLVSVNAQVVALQSGNIGDIIKIKTKDNKKLNAEIISNNKVVIR